LKDNLWIVFIEKFGFQTLAYRESKLKEKKIQVSIRPPPYPSLVTTKSLHHSAQYFLETSEMARNDTSSFCAYSTRHTT